MKRLMIAATLALILTMSVNVYAWTTLGSLRWPFDSTGYTDISPNGQIFMEYNTDLKPDGTRINKNHMAEDWNLLNGNDCDAPLYAIGDGLVKDVQNNPDVSPTIGKSLIVRYTLPDASQVDSVYWHLQSISVSVGMNVQKGDKIATIGNVNGQYSCHLHWEMRKGTAGLNLSWNANSYLNSATYPNSIEMHAPFTPPQTSGALDYTSPSLFIDDRKTSNVYGLSSGSWTYFSPSSNAPSSTSYVEYNGQRYSLQKAVNTALIWQYVYVWNNGWYPYPDITKVLFDAGRTYAVYSFVPNANLFILTPGHQYQADRAKIDMINSVKDNTSVKSAYVKYISTSWSDGTFTYWMMPFAYDNGSGFKYAYVEQATLISNPIIRYTVLYDPIIGNWTSWVAVDPNTLY